MRIPNKFNGYSADNRRLYNDPITMAMVGAAAGAALKPNDPLRGAMLGATVGFTGGTALGIGAGTTAAGTGLTASGSALGGSAATGTGTALTAKTVGGTLGSTGLTASNSALGGSLGSSAAAGGSAATGGSAITLGTGTSAGLSAVPASAPITSSVPGASYSLTGAPSSVNYSLVAPSPVTSPPTPTFMDQLSMSGKSAYENPMMTMQALNATQGLLSPEQIASAPAVPIQARGQLRPFNPMESMDPYRQSVISNQPISLLG